MKTLTITTIIPAYRAAKTIGPALDSVFAQTRLPDEILVVDDGSPDDLADATLPYEGRITLVRKANGGAASARNLGIDLAKGDLIAFLDADDYWEPTKLERQAEILRFHPEVGLTASRHYEQIPGQPRYAPVCDCFHLLNKVLTPSGPSVFEITTKIVTTTVVVRREVCQRFESGLEPAEDRELWMRLIQTAPAYITAERLATLVLEPGSISRSSVDADCSSMLRVVRRHGSMLGKRGLRTWEADTYRRWAGCHLARGQAREALNPAWNRLRRESFSLQAWWILLKCAATARQASRLS